MGKGHSVLTHSMGGCSFQPWCPDWLRLGEILCFTWLLQEEEGSMQGQLLIPLSPSPAHILLIATKAASGLVFYLLPSWKSHVCCLICNVGT